MIAISRRHRSSIVVIILFFMFLYYFPIGLWIRTIAAGVPLGIISLVRMRLIGIPPGVIVTNYVRARKAGLNLTVDQMQSHYLAGGNVENVTLAMIAAQRAQIPLEWQRAAAIDLAGRNVLEALQTSVNSEGHRDADLPRRRAERHSAQRQGAHHGAQQPRSLRRRRGRADRSSRVSAKASSPRSVPRSITRKSSNIRTASARRCSPRDSTRERRSRSSRSTSPTSTSGRTSAPSCRRAKPKPTGASRRPRPRNASTRRSRPSKSRRPRRRRCARKSSRPKPSIPLAIAEAFRSGNLGVMDYYRLKNIQADTEMR